MWYNSNWQYRRKITIDNTKVSAPSGGLSDFPIYMDLSDFDSTFFSNVKSDGSDVVITSDDGTTKLKRELVFIDTGGEKGELWFKAPTLDGSSDTVFYIYYGYTGASETNDTDVWDSYYKVVQHFNEDPTGSGACVKDSTSNSHDGTPQGIMTSGDLIETKLGKGLDLDNGDDFIDIPDSSDWDFGTNPFTLTFWIKPKSFSNYDGFFSTDDADYYGQVYQIDSSGRIAVALGNGSSWDIVGVFTSNSLIVNQFNRVDIVREGTGTNEFKVYINNVLGTQLTYATSNADSGTKFRIGRWLLYSRYFDGIYDELRVSKGIARSSDYRTTGYNNQNSASTFYSISAEMAVITNDATNVVFPTTEGSARLNGTLQGLVSGETAEVWFEYWKDESGASHTITSKQVLTTDSTFYVDITGLDLRTDYRFEAYAQKTISGEPIESGGEKTFGIGGNIYVSTDLRIIERVINGNRFVTKLDIVKRTTSKIGTDLRIKAKSTNNNYSTDLRVIKTSSDFWELEPKSLTDIVVKLDDVELTDISYSTLNINLNLNKTPSKATFVLARYHDRLDYKLDGTSSEITNENKIEIYDGNIKLFTGYITEIRANSTSDTVTINAEDARYKISANKSLKIDYGMNNTYPSTKDAINRVLTEISSYIQGHDEVFFGYVPDPAEIYNDCGSLLDLFVQNSGNINWYLDENEILRFSKIQQGTTKNLRLSSLDERRHVYDIIISDIILNKKTDNYVGSYEVILGTRYNYWWVRQRWNAGDTWWFSDMGSTDFTLFMWQIRYILQGYIHVHSTPQASEYIGMNLPTIYQQYVLGAKSLEQYVIGQWLHPTPYGYPNISDLDSIIIGSGEPVRNLYMTNYGIRRENMKWEEKIYPEYEDPAPRRGIKPGDVWLVEVFPEQYDRVQYALDLANFELSQNNRLITEATTTLLLDSYEYYNLSFKNLINIENTTQVDIYKWSNGFPLNIDSININCSNRVVTLYLTNYGKTYYKKTSSYSTNYIAEREHWFKPRVSQVIPGTVL